MSAPMTANCAIQTTSSVARAHGHGNVPRPMCTKVTVRTPLSRGQVSRSRERLLTCACSATDSTAEAGDTVDLPDQEEEPKERRLTVTIKKPMGMVLAERSDGVVFVESIQPGGNADEDGRVQVGDAIRKCSARVLKEGKEGNYQKQGHSARPYEDWLPIMFDCDGQDFKTVMAAIGSNNERWGIKDVTLEVSRAA